jgi:hypothetical protein
MADKFYTHAHVAKTCFGLLEPMLVPTDILIEPSAGNGSFIPFVEKYNHVCIDVAPDDSRILQADFLTFDGPPNAVVIGNPPFGKQGSLAKKFIKKACSFARIIAFILPKSFKKDSMTSCFDRHFHCVTQIDLPRNSFFIPDGPLVYDVPCVFQIWERFSHERPVYSLVEPSWMRFVRKSEPHTCSFRRVGVYAGEVDTVTENKSESSHYFIRFDDDTYVDALRSITWSHDNTVGPRSIGKKELIVELLRVINGN